jgi:hypothetical protein
MDVANTTLAERVARALAGMDHSANGEGVETSAAGSVNETWRAYLPHVQAVMRTMREPSGPMATVGDPRIWAAMVDVAIRESGTL